MTNTKTEMSKKRVSSFARLNVISIALFCANASSTAIDPEVRGVARARAGLMSRIIGRLVPGEVMGSYDRASESPIFGGLAAYKRVLPVAGHHI